MTRAIATWKDRPLNKLDYDDLLACAQEMADVIAYLQRRLGLVSHGFDRPHFTKPKRDPAYEEAYKAGYEEGRRLVQEKHHD